MPTVVSVQFGNAGKLYDFESNSLDLKQGDKVIVETEKGISLATVVKAPFAVDNLSHTLATVKRKASDEDLAAAQRNTDKEKEAFDFCLKRIAERGMDMKLVKVEYLFDSSKAVFYFTADGRVDFRELVKDLAHTFHTRIEMRQIGVRDEAKMVGGLGICGRELCCSSFLRDFQPVSVKMAKEQNLALNPSKISGQCGRLLCCLEYEYEAYCCLRKNLPKCGKRARTESVSGIIDKVNLLTGDVNLKTDDDKIVTVKQSELIDDTRGSDSPQSCAAAKNTSPCRQQQSPAQEQVPAASLEASRQTPATETPVNDLRQDRKRRNRRHGHRKKSDSSKSGDKST